MMRGVSAPIVLTLVTGALAAAQVLRVGPGRQYLNLEPAAAAANAGDTIMFDGGVYEGGQYVEGLQGTAGASIVITPAAGESVFVRGGGTAWQFSDPAYVSIEGFVFEHQSLNGVNIDDGGDYATPAHDVRIIRCVFRYLNASGNNDLLKMSGVDQFEVAACSFTDGAAGGSGIDLVGCHSGRIEGNSFERMGSNSIQAKGGSADITIARNRFVHGGQRTLNLGGSTGLQFFRPLDAPYEASNLHVYANVFAGSDAPVAFVGCVQSDVVNNTIAKPAVWVVRILQETVDPVRFLECGDNTFANNIVYQGTIRTETNVGPNTRPESFLFENNLWFNYQDPSWEGPAIPVDDPGLIVGSDPMFVDTLLGDYRLKPGSPAIGRITWSGRPGRDLFDIAFAEPRSAGAVEGAVSTGVPTTAVGAEVYDLISNYPNPFNPATTIMFLLPAESIVSLEVFNTLGQRIARLVDGALPAGVHRIPWRSVVSSGVYFCRLQASPVHGHRPLFTETRRMVRLP
jgi:hypothetical protein